MKPQPFHVPLKAFSYTTFVWFTPLTTEQKKEVSLEILCKVMQKTRTLYASGPGKLFR